MAVANTNLLELLGKEVSFTYVDEWREVPKKVL